MLGFLWTKDSVLFTFPLQGDTWFGLSAGSGDAQHWTPLSSRWFLVMFSSKSDIKLLGKGDHLGEHPQAKHAAPTREALWPSKTEKKMTRRSAAEKEKKWNWCYWCYWNKGWHIVQNRDTDPCLMCPFFSSLKSCNTSSPSKCE